MTELHTPSARQRSKLGLSLAGGGFRASLFHVGVLRRMAELDLLRYVEVLSTVSGGSITGALYALLLRKHLEGQGKEVLEQQEYEDLVDELQGALLAGISRDLRNRLFVNPFALAKIILTRGDSLGKRMSRLYAEYFYDGLGLGGRLKLQDLHVRPGGRSIEGSIDAYNAVVVEEGGSAVTKLVLNATSLNSGRPFTFSGAEVCDPGLGYIRVDELEELVEVKAKQKLWARAGTHDGVGSMRAWVASRCVSSRRQSPTEFGWEAAPGLVDLTDALLLCDHGQLRRAKLAAWRMRGGDNGVLSEQTRREQLWDALTLITAGKPELIEVLKSGAEDDVLDVVVELHLQRTAVAVSRDVRRAWRAITIAEAVGCSACFPPVFAPITLGELFDRKTTERVTVTDGGVYDNVGLQSLLDEGCTHIIASDTSGVFDVLAKAPAGHLTMVGRLTSTLMDHIAALQRQVLRERRRVTKEAPANAEGLQSYLSSRRLEGLAFFHIRSEAVNTGLAPIVERDLIAKIRTDLDAFGETEQALLINQGYQLADRYIREYLSDSPYSRGDWRPAEKWPIPISGEIAKRAGEIAKDASSGFFRGLNVILRRRGVRIIRSCVAIVALIVILTCVVLLALIGLEVANVSFGFSHRIIGLCLPFLPIVGSIPAVALVSLAICRVAALRLLLRVVLLLPFALIAALVGMLAGWLGLGLNLVWRRSTKLSATE